jgi:ATP-binding cassette subfamily G (WHITE) protein 2 (SNQ2)
LTVDGNRFVNLSFGYSWDNTALNFGVMIIFFIGFFVALLVFTEFNTKEEHSTVTTLFKRGSKASKAIVTDKADEEKVNSGDRNPGHLTPTSKAKGALTMKDVFSWQKLCYDITLPTGDDRRLLNEISGYVAPGKLTALMGESGAGKTTLLNVLAKRTTMGVVTGDCFVNGRELPTDFQCQTGYCQQMDTHLGTATVREALLFSAKLRQPQSVPLAEKEAYVEECLAMCGLTAYADAIIGTLGVEHRKRTTIGVELAAKPKLLLFLDEPTSGLDSQSAWAIVSFLRELADAGQAILCTIHQPSAELFQVFDRLLLLQKGGKTVYFGDIGRHSSKLISYFERNNSRSCGPEENPAEFMLDVIGAGATAKAEQNWSDVWARSPEAELSRAEISDIVEQARSRGAVSTTIHSEFATPWLYQLKELAVRDMVSHWRDPTYLLAKMSLNIVSGLFIGFTFFNSKDTIAGSQNKLFSVYISTMMIVPLANQLMLNFLTTRNVYEIRERPSRMYSWTALITAQILVAIPWNVIGSIIYFFIWYWTTGLDTDRAPFTLLMYIVIFPFYYTTVTMAVAAMSPSMEVAAITFSFLFAFIFTTNGVLQPFSKLGWWQWMYWASPFTYLVETIVAQAIGKQNINCSALEYVPIVPPSGQTCGDYMQGFMSFAGGYVKDTSATDICQFCVYRTTDEYMDKFLHMYHKNVWRDVGFVAAFILFNTFCIYAFTYLFRIHTGSFFSFKKAKKSA